MDYYTNYIKERNDWEFVGIYTDEGISATNTRHRDGFKRMVRDAMDGKIDLIVTKSVSRIKCGRCGGWYGAKVWHSTDKYRRTIYRCNGKFKVYSKDDIRVTFKDGTEIRA